MVCQKCEKKLSKVICPEPWKQGASEYKAESGSGKGGRQVNENKLLSKKNRFQPYQAKCKVCKNSLHQQGAIFCQTCAYSKGVCALCGKQILDTSSHKMSHA